MSRQQSGLNRFEVDKSCFNVLAESVSNQTSNVKYKTVNKLVGGLYRGSKFLEEAEGSNINLQNKYDYPTFPTNGRNLSSEYKFAFRRVRLEIVVFIYSTCKSGKRIRLIKFLDGQS